MTSPMIQRIAAYTRAGQDVPQISTMRAATIDDFSGAAEARNASPYCRSKLRTLNNAEALAVRPYWTTITSGGGGSSYSVATRRRLRSSTARWFM
jgi:hypothetical protein